MINILRMSWPRDDRDIARLAIFTAVYLHKVDTIALHDLGQALSDAADRHRIPRYCDNSQLVRIMQRLGWRKVGYAGEGSHRSPRYVRTAADNAKAA